MAVDAGAFAAGPPIRRARLRLSGLLWRWPWLKALGLLTPPLAAFLVVYVGSLAILFVSSLWTSNSFTSAIEHTWTLANYRLILSTSQPYLHIAQFVESMFWIGSPRPPSAQLIAPSWARIVRQA